MRVVGQEVFRPGVQIGEVAPPAARNADFLGDFGPMIEQEYAPSALPGKRRTQQTRSASAQDDGVKVLQGRNGATRRGVES